MAGYSSRSLAQKLGIKEGHKVLLILAPSEYEKTLGPLPGVFPFHAATVAQADSKSLSKSAPFDFIHCFCRQEAELQALFPVMKNLLAKNGMVWVSWLKKTKGPGAINNGGAVKGEGNSAAAKGAVESPASKGAKTMPGKTSATPLGETRPAL